MAGRKPKYESAAEKQAAYRARKSEKRNTDALRNCPNCQSDRLQDVTDMGFNFLSVVKAHDGKAFICFNCWCCTTKIGDEIQTGELMVRLTWAGQQLAAHRRG